MNHHSTPFSGSYAEARSKFLQAASAAGLAVQSHLHPLRGMDGEALAMDVAIDGPADADALLVISSGCHGAEGFCGSGVQVALLRDLPWRERVRASGCAVMYIHALNPHGFSWLRRVTHENVDLNRNFHDFSRALPANAAYDEIAHLVVPPTWPAPLAITQEIDRYIARHGIHGWQAAMTGGQYSHPEGPFFGGTEPTWSNRTLRKVLQQHAQQCQRLGWIDVHTGLGPSGHGERIFLDIDDPASLARARAWWGEDVTSIHDGSSSSAPLTGLLCFGIREACAQATYSGIAMEYGTLQPEQVLDALRADHWLHLHPEADAEVARAIRQTMKDTYYVDDDGWRAAILAQAFEAAYQAIDGLMD